MQPGRINGQGQKPIVALREHAQRIDQLHDRAKQLGAVREELATLGCFFTRKWDRTAQELRDDFQADILQLAGDRLKDLGRSEESHQAYLAAMDRYTETGNMERYQQVKGKLHG